MNTNTIQLFEGSTVEAIAIYTFLLIIISCFIKYLIVRGEADSQGVQKIIGGLAVFVVSLLSGNFWIQALSLFIGGLIIASEEFMQKLAIIVRSESGDIGKNLSTTKPTKDEINEKREEEVTQLETNTPKKVRRTTLLRTVVLTESLVADYLRKKIGDRFREEVKFENTNFVADGIITDRDGNIVTIVEIKHLRSFFNALVIFKNSIEQIKNVIPKLPLLICIVFDKKPTENETIMLLKYAQSLEHVSISIFYLKNQKLIPVIEPEIQ